VRTPDRELTGALPESIGPQRNERSRLARLRRVATTLPITDDAPPQREARARKASRAGSDDLEGRVPLRLRSSRRRP
jgi:hypothetical protein